MFKEILSEKWELLSPAIQQHFDLNEGEEVKLEGKLTVRHGKFIKLLMPFIRLTGALVPVEGDNFTVTVENKKVNDIFYWHRQFKKDQKTYKFTSKMQRFDNDIVEFVGLNLGIRLGLNVINSGLIFEDKGYVFKFGSRLIPIPVQFLMGRSHIKEYTLKDSPHDLEMKFVVHHPCFGFGFSYMGYFDFKA